MSTEKIYDRVKQALQKSKDRVFQGERGQLVSERLFEGREIVVPAVATTAVERGGETTVRHMKGTCSKCDCVYVSHF